MSRQAHARVGEKHFEIVDPSFQIAGFHCHATVVCVKKKIETIPWMKSRHWHVIDDT